MAIMIESRYNDGYLAHHASDVTMVRIVHRPEDGYFLSYDKEVIREKLQLRDFIHILRQAEGAQKNSLESEIHDIDRALRQRKERELCEWLDHRYVKLIREKKLVLMQHGYSVNIHAATQTWNPDQVKKKQEEMGVVPKGVKDEEVYYTMIK